MQRDFIATRFPEFHERGLTPLAGYLYAHGGFDQLHPAVVGPIDYHNVQIGFTSGAADAIFHQLFAIAGLPVFTAEVLYPNDIRQPCAANFDVSWGIGIMLNGAPRLFVPSHNDAHGEQHPYVVLSTMEALAHDTSLSTFLARTPGLQPWFAERSRDFITQFKHVAELKGAIDRPSPPDPVAIHGIIDAARKNPFVAGHAILFLGDAGLFAPANELLHTLPLTQWYGPIVPRIFEAMVAWNRDDYAQLDQLAQTLRATQPECPIADLIALRAAVGLHRWGLALRIAPRVEMAISPDAPGNVVDRIVGYVELQQGQWKRAAMRFQRVVAITGTPAAQAVAFFGLAIIAKKSPTLLGEDYAFYLKKYRTVIQTIGATQSIVDVTTQWTRFTDFERTGLWPLADTSDLPLRGMEAQVYAAFGRALQLHGDLARAEECFTRAASHAPHEVGIYLDLVSVWAAQGKWDHVKDGVGELPERIQKLRSAP